MIPDICFGVNLSSPAASRSTERISSSSNPPLPSTSASANFSLRNASTRAGDIPRKTVSALFSLARSLMASTRLRCRLRSSMP